jgi:hypothetical protein
MATTATRPRSPTSMIEMTQNINENWAAHVQANKEVGVTCIHLSPRTERALNVWFRVGPVNSNAGWPAIQNRVTMTSNFTSLPSDLPGELPARGRESGSTASRRSMTFVPGVEPGYPGIQQAEMTYSLDELHRQLARRELRVLPQQPRVLRRGAGDPAMVDGQPGHHHGAGAAGTTTSCRWRMNTRRAPRPDLCRRAKLPADLPQGEQQPLKA